MKLRVYFIAIPIAFIISACSENDNQSRNDNTQAQEVESTKIKTYDNSIAVKMPHLPNSSNLPTENLEVK